HFDVEIADDRIRKFAKLEMSDELFRRCGLLLEFLSDRSYDVPFNPDWKTLLRLPGTSVAGCRVVLPASECRPEAFIPLVEYVLGIVQMHVKQSLQDDLGWNELINPGVLGLRINSIVTRFESSLVETALFPVFAYIESKTADLGDQI